MKDPVKHGGGRGACFVKRETLNDLADCILERTPKDGIGTKITPVRNGFTVDVVAGSGQGAEPFKVTAYKNESASGITIQSGIVYYVPASGTVQKYSIAATSHAGYDDPHIKIAGTTTDNVFTPTGATLDYNDSPTNTDIAKFVRIATVSSVGVVAQELQSDFFFKQRDHRFWEPGCEVFVDWQPEFISFSEEQHPFTRVYSFAGILNSSASMVADEEPYTLGFPSRDLPSYCYGAAFICGAVSGANAAAIQASFKNHVRTFLDAEEGVDIDDYTIHQIVDHGDGSGGDDPATSDFFDEILRELSEFRYRASVSPFSPEDMTRLELRWG